jgi:hypothetical protein
MSIDKEIVKMEKSNATVVGFKIDGKKIFTEYYKELIEELCYHALAKEWSSGEDADPAGAFKFIEEQVKDMLLTMTSKIAHVKMLEIITQDADEIKREIMKRCFDEDVEVIDDRDEKTEVESVVKDE